MAQDLSNAEGIEIDGDYLNGKLKDNQTRVNAFINQDIVQFFQKLMDLASISPNDQDDNEANGYQFIDALVAKIRDTEASTTEKGTVEKATTAEAQSGAADKFLDAALLQLVTATTTRKGIVEKATTAEAQAGTAEKYLDAALLQLVTATTSRKGVAEIATTAEAQALTDDTRIMTPNKVGAITDGTLIKILNIGDWDMNALSGVLVTHGLTLSKIISVEAYIRRDDDASSEPSAISSLIGGPCFGTVTYDTLAGKVGARASDVVLIRDAQIFNYQNTSYNKTSYNRGYIVIRHLP